MLFSESLHVASWILVNLCNLKIFIMVDYFEKNYKIKTLYIKICCVSTVR